MPTLVSIATHGDQFAIITALMAAAAIAGWKTHQIATNRARHARHQRRRYRTLYRL